MSTDISERAKKRLLISIMEAEEDTGMSLLKLFRDRDSLDSYEVSSGNFKNIIEKVLPSITRDEVNAIFHDYQKPGQERANYELFLGALNKIRQKKKVLIDILEQIMDQFSAKDNTLFDLFESADKDHNGVLTKKEFLDVLNNFGIYYDEDQMDDFFYFLDSNRDNGVSYKELQTYFTKYVKSRGKNINDLTRSSFFKDPKGYWGKKIFVEASRYLTQKRQSLPDFFREYGMMNDFSISQYEFTEAMEALIRNLDKNDLYKIINEMDDKTTNKISIKKFQEVYNAIAADNSSTGGIGGGYDDDFDRTQKIREMLRTIAAVVGAKHFSYDDFFSKYGYNRNMMTISETRFDQAIEDLHLRLTADDIRTLKKELDPLRTGAMNLSKLFDIKPDSSIQTSYMEPGTLTAREKDDLKSLLEEVGGRIKKKDIDLQAQFAKYDIRKEGYLSNDEFIVILKDNQIGVGTQDQDLFFKAYGDAKTRKINYKRFCNAIQDSSFGGSTLAKSEMSKSISPAVLDEKQRLLFKAIREQYASLEELFKAHDRNGDDSISKPEFLQVMKTLKLEMTSDEMEGLYERIDAKKQGKIYFVNMSLAFKTHSEDDCKNIATQILRPFVTEGKSLFEVLANFPKSGDYMKFMDFMDALQSVSRKIGLRDVQFLLSFLSIKLNLQREINVVEFSDGLQSFALRQRVINDVEAERIFTRAVRSPTLRQQSFGRVGSGSRDSPQKGSNLLDKFKIKLGLNSRDKILEFWRLIDRDNSKTITLSEFKRSIKMLNPEFSDSELNQIFRELDVADKGVFSSSDMLEVLTVNNNSTASPVKSPASGGMRNSMRSSTIDIIERTKGSKQVFLNIMEMLNERREKFSDYFYAPDQRMNIIEAKLRLNKLGVRMDEKVSELLNDLCDEQQPNLINISYFEKCYNYHKDRAEMGGHQLKRPTDPYVDIRDALKRNKLTFNNTFARSDHSNRGYISTGAFKNVLSDDLYVNLDPEILRTILREISDDEGRVSLVKLREGIEGFGDNRDNKDSRDNWDNKGNRDNWDNRDNRDSDKDTVEELLQKLRVAMKNNNMTVQRMFDFFDINKNQKIDYEEFQKMILKIDSNLPLNKINKLFRHIDKSQDGRISPQEFQACFETSNEKGERAFESLKNMLRRQQMEPERAFEIFDRNQNGTIEFSEFCEVLDRYDVTLDVEDKNFLFRKFDNNQNGKISRGEFLEHFETGSKKGRVEEDPKIKTLLEDLRSQLRSKNRNDTSRLFEMVDSNRDDKVQPTEFVQFAQMINPSIRSSEAMDMFRMIDQNKDNVISYSEFAKYFNVNNYEIERGFRDEGKIQDERAERALDLLRKALRDKRMDADKAFTIFDRNYNNLLEFNELNEGIESFNINLTREEVNALFKKLDVNQNGKIPAREFVRQLEATNRPQVPETNPKIQRLLDDVKQTLRNKNRSDLSRLFDVVDLNNDNRVTPQEFIQFIRNVDPSILANEAHAIFKIVDTNHDEIISFSEFVDAFNVNRYDIPPRQQKPGPAYGVSEGIIERARWAEEIFEEMGHVLRVEQVTFTDHFFTPDDKMEKNVFRKRLNMLGMDIPPENFDRFFKNFQNARDLDKIDLPDIRRCFEHYKDAGRLSFGALKNRRLNLVIKEIKSGINREGYTIPKFINGLDRYNAGNCSRAELQTMLVDRLRVPDNVNLKFLYDAIARDDEKKTMNLNRLDQLLTEGGVSDTLQPLPGEGYRGDAEAILKTIRSSIERTGISSEQIYKRFNANQDNSINYEEFYNGIKNLDQTLSRNDIKSVFDLLDRERTGQISKFKFMTSFGKITTAEIPVYLNWARPIFIEINKHLEDNKLDLYRVMKPHKNLIDKADFRQGLYLIGLNTDRYGKEIQDISEVLLEGRPEGLNFEALEECLKKAKEPEVAVKPPHSGNFTPDEKASIDKMFQEIAKFMKVDNISFDQLFLSKDHKKDGSITEKDFKATLLQELYISDNPKLDLLIEFVKNKQGNIDLVLLRKHLNQGVDAIAPVLPLEHFIKTLKERFQHNTDTIIKFFDYNNNKQISRKEFVDCCKQAVNTDKELALFYFSQLDTKNAGEITSAHFREAIEADDTDRRGFFKKVRLFVIDNKNYLLRNMDSLDDDKSKTLNLNQIKIAFSNSQLSTTNEEVSELVARLGIRKDMRNKYNYLELVEAIINTDHQKQELAEIDQILARLKAQATAKGLDLVAIFKVHDVRGNHMITLKNVYEELDKHDIHLNKDEKNLLLPLLNPVNDTINYYDLTRLIFNGRSKSQDKHAFLVEAAWAKSLVLTIKDGMKRNNVNSVRLFGLRQNEEYIPTRDFITGIEYLGIKRYANEWKQFTDLLTHPSQPDMVSIPMFEYLLDNMEDVPEFEDKDARVLDQRFAQIRGFMKEDNKTFRGVFPKYDRDNTGFIHQEDMKRILVNELYLDITPELERFIGMMTDRKGFISLEFLRKNLELPQDGRAAPPMHSSSLNKSGTMNPPTTSQQYQSQQHPSQQHPSQQYPQQQYPSQQYPTIRQESMGHPTQQLPGSHASPNAGPYAGAFPGAAQALGTQSQYNKAQGQSMVNKLGQQQYPQGQQQYPQTQQQYPQDQQKYPSNQTQAQYPQGQNQAANRQFDTPAYGGPQGAQVNFSGDLVVDIKRFFRSLKLNNPDRFAYFGGETKGVISKQEFFNKIVAMNIANVTHHQINGLFEKLDTNNTGFISENEFRLVFDDAEDQFQTRDVKMTAEMNEQIYQLFREIDLDNNGHITISELASSLGKMGANPTSDEVRSIFEQFDKNGDGKISYQEFKLVMEDKLKKDILHLEGLLSDLRAEFKRVDVYNRGFLTPQQLAQALVNLNIDLKQEDFLALVDAIDKDRSGTIDIDEFIGFIMTPPDKNSFSSEADAAIVNIKRSRKPSLVDMMESYRYMPYNFVASFTRDLTRKLMNLPSSALKPKLNASGAFYTDLLPNLERNKAQAQQTGLMRRFTSNPKAAAAEVLTVPSELSAEIVLTTAKGIPIPPENDKNVNRDQNIVGREVRILIFSKTLKKFVSNIVTVPVDWDPQLEDVWNFPARNANENTILIRLANFTPTEEYDTGLQLVFDLVVFYRRNDQIIEMSSGWAGIDLQDLRYSKPHSLKLKGGTPLREVNINDADVRTNRKGWRQMVKMLSTKQVGSKLKIEVRATEKLYTDTKNDLEYLPPMILLNRNALNICKIHRNYLGSIYREAVEKGNDIDLINDVLAKGFRKAIDCPNTWMEVVNVWNNTVLPRVKAQDITVAVAYLKVIMRYLYLLFSTSEFKFADTDPTFRIDYDLNLRETRRRLTIIYLDNALQELNLKPPGASVIPVSASQSSFKPFNIHELIEDDNDATFFDQLRNIKSNVSLKQQY